MIMMNTVLTKTFPPPPIDKKEILRYAGVKDSIPDIDALLCECLGEIADKLTYNVCYTQFPFEFSHDEVNLFFARTKSKKLRKNLEGCKSFILFAATVGIEIDRLILKYGKISPSKALMLQAIGAERIESLCNEFNRTITKEYGYTKPRFSPGYGDLALKIQQDFFRVLDPSRRIGLTLNSSMLMTPTKSVTAIIGISDKEEISIEHNCSSCNKTDCSFRRKP